MDGQMVFTEEHSSWQIDVKFTAWFLPVLSQSWPEGQPPTPPSLHLCLQTPEGSQISLPGQPAFVGSKSGSQVNVGLQPIKKNMPEKTNPFHISKLLRV
jgi:hypothetical protein